MIKIPDDLKPTRTGEGTTDFLGIRFVSTPDRPPGPVVAKPEKLARVKLVGQDGNAFNLLGLCKRAGQKAGYSKEQLDAFMNEAMSGDYDHLLRTCMKWFEVR